MQMQHGTCTFGDMIPVITNNGVNLVYKDGVTCEKPNFLIPGIEDTYTHYNAHIHLSSEHTIDGLYYAAEMHMVHLRADGQRAAVVGTMIEPDRVTDNPVFEVFLNYWKKARKDVDCGECDVDTSLFSTTEDMHPYKMLETNSFFHYDGGLTTPPCSEIVWWNLAAEPMSVSVRQFAELSDIILNTKTLQKGECKKITVASKSGSTSRPPQPLFGRVVDKICPTTMEPHSHSGMEGEHSHDVEEEESSASATTMAVGALSFAAVVAGQMI